jgi:hypothetical protein
MFTKNNIVSVRYTDPQNTTIEVLYTDHVDGKTRPFYFPSSPTTTVMWKILKEAKWTPSKVADSTVEWIKDQTTLQYQVAERFAEQLAAEQISNESNRLRDDYNKQVMDIRERYDARVMDMSSSMNNESTGSSLYTLINDLNANEEAVFKLKLDILEDASNFQGINKTDEKARRRDIRKCKTLKELLNFL